MDRRQFGCLIASVGTAAILTSQPVLSGAAELAAVPVSPQPSKTLTLKTSLSAFTIDATGALSAITANGHNYLASEEPAPVLSVRVSGKLHGANRSAWDKIGTTLRLEYDSIGVTAVVAVCAKPTHVTFELTELLNADKVELVLWGPYPVGIGDLIGEVVGVVRDSTFAVGIQALNAKTLGGYPLLENDDEPTDVPADDNGIYPGLPDELKRQQSWRGDTAKATPFGSTLQAYCRKRDRQRDISNWGYDKFVSVPYNDGGVIGSKIALFACPATESLPTLGEIEVAEGLPHPMLDGKWAKIAYSATASYLIVDFGEATIDRAIQMTKQAGFKYLYQSSPFERWGHFKLKSDLFPNGWDGFHDCVEKALQAGIGVGFHTLSNFITPNDSYVSPIPDPRLARAGTSELTADIDWTQTELPIADATWFEKKTVLNTVVVGEELIRYNGVSMEAPWRLLQCQRGAWGTKAGAHRNGDGVGKLLDHDYKVFLTDAALGQEVARNVAAFCNRTGAKQLSFDGLEGNGASGTGQYGCTLFTEAWYNALTPALRGRVINDASNAHHFTWHIATRYNWGEPWYAGFRQSQTLLRMKNQLFFTRNLLPHMLGWFSVRKDTTAEDAAWLCARAAGYDAGFALATSFESQAKQASGNVGDIDKEKTAIFEVIRQWETARQTGAFPESLKSELRDTGKEFLLVAIGPGEWDLQRVNPPGPTERIKAQSERMKSWSVFDGASA